MTNDIPLFDSFFGFESCVEVAFLFFPFIFKF